jgi:hypothetical protein
MIQPVNKICPICGGYVYINTIGTEICQSCNYVLPSSNFATSEYSYNSTNSNERYCPICNKKLNQDGSWWRCPECKYGQIDYIGDHPDQTFTSADSVIKAPDPLEPFTLEINNCKCIKLGHKELDIEFTLEPDKLKNVDTLIINGYKYIKEKIG